MVNTKIATVRQIDYDVSYIKKVCANVIHKRLTQEQMVNICSEIMKLIE